MRNNAIPSILKLLAIIILNASPILARELTFEERVEAQRAIERVYYSHQIGATRPFEEAIPREFLENKVRTYLKQSAALEGFWHSPVTADALQHEQERIVRGTHMAGRLQEIYTALENDPFLVQECFARASLVNRLSRSFYATDQRIHSATRAEAEDLRQRLLEGDLDVFAEELHRQEFEVWRATNAGEGENDRFDATSNQSMTLHADRLELNTEDYLRWRAAAPEHVGEVGPLAEEAESFVVKVVLSTDARRSRVAVYVVRKTPWEQWWETNQSSFLEATVDTVASPSTGIAAPFAAGVAVGARCVPGDSWSNSSFSSLPEGRWGHTAVWAGNVMIIWGGYYGGGVANTGARYDPVTDTWSPTSTLGAPAARGGQTALWTGREMLVWGGSIFYSQTQTGGRYDPTTDTWALMSTAGAPSPPAAHTAVWTGREMIVWGGSDGYLPLVTGGRYDPTTDTWAPMSTAGAPSPRLQHTGVWTGRVMFVWGGSYPIGMSTGMNTGGLYDPSTDRWTATSTLNAPTARYKPTAVWTGNRVVVWSGIGASSTRLNSGGQYDPENDRWTPTAIRDAPSAREFHRALWTGKEMVVWGGENINSFLDTGGRYDPLEDVWRSISATNAPSGRSLHTAVWTGKLVLIWGGRRGGPLNTGGRYDPEGDTWTPTTLNNLPEGRSSHSAIWTGTHMVIWGGHTEVTPLGTGARYDPLTDSWAPTSVGNSPTARFGATAVWTGDEVLLWGGSAFPYEGFMDGGRYDPNIDRWSPISRIRAPSARVGHTAVWTGSLMIVWGGAGHSPYTLLTTGGRYDPRTDTWTPTTTIGVPTARLNHAGVWTGREMIIWGGYPEYGGGARYDPDRDAWTPMTFLHEPQGRSDPAAVWTGKTMIVWGGSDGGSYRSSGGVYDPKTDSWSATTSDGAPSGRIGHTAVWTGASMLVWGGYPGTSPFEANNSGRRYEPERNAWSTISPMGAPTGRTEHTAIWTGTEMIVSGGSIGTLYPQGGGRYAPDPINGPPVAYAGEDRIVECAGPGGTSVVLSGTGEFCDTVTLSTITWNGPFPEGSGTVAGSTATVTLPLGSNILTLVVEDDKGQRTTDTLTVTVRDTAPPALTCPEVAPVECSSPDGTPSTVRPAHATDTCDPNPIVVNSHGVGGADASGTYSLGTTDVEMTVTDASGNEASCVFPVTVRDTMSPQIVLTLSPTVLWPPNHRLVDVGTIVTASDKCGTPSVVLTSITSSGADDAVGSGDGNTARDIQGANPDTLDFDFQLRAERNGGGEGRVYSVTYTTADGSGNSTHATARVVVPHDQGGGSEPLLLSTQEKAGGTVFEWNPVPGAISYSVVRGDLSSLKEGSDFIDLGTVVCLLPRSTLTSTTGHEDAEVPLAGQAFFYLAAYNDGQASGYGSDTATKPRLKTGGGCE